MQTLKYFSVAVLFLMIGVGATLAYSHYTQIAQENARLKASQATTTSDPQPKPSVTPSASGTPAAPVPTATPTPQQIPEKTASIMGKLGYPSQGIPPLVVYAQSTSNPAVYFKTTTKTNDMTFTISNVTPGTYHVFAYPVDTDKLAGGYTKAVPCGLRVECTDHSLIAVTVAAGETNNEAEVTDWYASDKMPKKLE